MWTPATREQHSRSDLRYSTDLTDAEWAVIEPLLPPANPLGRPRLDRASRATSQANDGRFARNPDASEATTEEVRDIIAAFLEELRLRVAQVSGAAPRRSGSFVMLQAMEPVRDRILAERKRWLTLNE